MLLKLTKAAASALDILKIKNYWNQTEFGNYSNEINKEDITSFIENNFIYQRLKSYFYINW